MHDCCAVKRTRAWAPKASAARLPFRTLLIYRGVILWDQARKDHLTELEILGALRGKGVAAVEDVLALVLEPDGTFSVITKDAAKEGQIPTSLADVENVPDFSADAPPEARRKLREAA